MKFTLKLFLTILIFTITAFAQENSKTPVKTGAEFFRQGKYDEAIKILRKATSQNKEDAEAWNLLGLAQLEKNEFKDSRKSLETAVKINSQSAIYRLNLSYANLLSNKLNSAEEEIEKAISLNQKSVESYYLRGVIKLRMFKYESAVEDADRALQLNQKYSSAHILKSDAFLYNFSNEIAKGAKISDKIELLKKSFEAIELCRNVCNKDSDAKLVEDRWDSTKAFYNYFSQRQNATLEPVNQIAAVPDNSITPLKVLNKPRAGYTNSARQAGVQGIIRLAVYFGEDGKIKHIFVMKPLSNGLTEEAVAAARGIRFSPQLKDGKPVSVIKVVEYNFALY